MREARELRETNGLNDTFAMQTLLRTEIFSLQRALAALPTQMLPPDIAGPVKELLTNGIADRAEELYTLTEKTS
jgi:hypothetical protein